MKKNCTATTTGSQITDHEKPTWAKNMKIGTVSSPTPKCASPTTICVTGSRARGKYTSVTSEEFALTTPIDPMSDCDNHLYDSSETRIVTRAVGSDDPRCVRMLIRT